MRTQTLPRKIRFSPMARKPHHLPIIYCFVLIISSFGLINVSAKLVYEDGYIVTTVIDGNHVNLNPYSVLSRSDPLNDLVVLDSSSKSVPKRLSGIGVAGFSDGELGSAMFNKPRSFAVDMKGNVYVADRSNLAIRKISASGVTTIAGGYATKPGHADGPGKNASFSDDFEITFVPNMCALLVSDHGHKLIRQINLRTKDCSKSSSSGWGISLAWTLGLVASCLLSFIVGFVVNPYIASGEVKGIKCGETWSRYFQLMSRNQVEMLCFASYFQLMLRNQVEMRCFATRSVAASFELVSASKQLLLLTFSHMSLMFKFGLERRNTSSCAVNKEQQFVSLIDADSLNHSEYSGSGKYEEQLRDLISLDGDYELPGTSCLVSLVNEDKSTEISFSDGGRKLEGMMEGNLTSFTENAESFSQLEDLLVGGSNLVKRR